MLKDLVSLEICNLELQKHFVLSQSANAGTVIDSLLNVKKTFINSGRQFFSPPQAAQTLVTPLLKPGLRGEKQVLFDELFLFV